MCWSYRSGGAVSRNGPAQSGSDIRTVQELLGHADVRATQVYTYALNRGAHGVLSPADRL